MDSLIKFLVALIAFVIFVYCATRAFQGDLDMGVFSADMHALSNYIKILIEKFF